MNKLEVIIDKNQLDIYYSSDKVKIEDKTLLKSTLDNYVINKEDEIYDIYEEFIERYSKNKAKILTLLLNESYFDYGNKYDEPVYQLLDLLIYHILYENINNKISIKINGYDLPQTGSELIRWDIDSYFNRLIN